MLLLLRPWDGRLVHTAARAGERGLFRRGSLFRRDPSFGPLASSPVEREVELTAEQYLAFAASGATCTSVVRQLVSDRSIVSLFTGSSKFVSCT